MRKHQEEVGGKPMVMRSKMYFHPPRHSQNIQPSGTIHLSVLSPTQLLFSFAPATYYSPSYNSSTPLPSGVLALWKTALNLLFTSLWKPDFPENAASPAGLWLLHLRLGIRIPYKLLSSILKYQHQQSLSSKFSFHSRSFTQCETLLALSFFLSSPSLLPLSTLSPAITITHYYMNAHYLYGQPPPSSPCLLTKKQRVESPKRYLKPPVADSQQGAQP